MTIYEFLAGSGGVLFIIATIVEIAPVKINPWSKLAKMFGNAINGDVIKQLGEVKDDLKVLKERDAKQDAEREMDKALDARRRIIQFADEIRRNIRHSEEHFNGVFDDIKFYKNYCREHPEFENDKAVSSISIIEDVYHKCIIENTFL